MTKISFFLKKNIYIFIIFIVVVLISLLNYKKSTFISGWDTLHPEFDFSLNFKRLFLGVWREEQGLGAPPSHAHMADLPRVLILWFLHFFLPINTLRYFYIFSCLLFGVFGIYHLISFLLNRNGNKYYKLTAFLASLFYLFNLSTLQQFYVPFEMFTVQYAFLPYLILYSLKFLINKNKKNLLIFALINFFATPQAYAPHLWYAFFITYCLFLVSYFFINLNKSNLKKILILIFITLIVNSFWLLPSFYYIKNFGFIPSQSKQNRLFSQEYKLRNEKNGILKDVSILKGFYFDWSIYDFKKEKIVPLMEDWNNYFNQSNITLIGYGLFILSLFGIVLSLINKNDFFISLLPFFTIPFIFLMNNTFPFSLLNNFLSQFSFLKEGLRFIFTKFSILLSFSYVLFFSLAINYLFNFSKKYFIFLYSFFIFFLLFLYVKPFFSGNLISEKMRINIPNNYFSLFSYLKNKPKQRILVLPLHNFAGWQYNNWGYQGAGFIWFGLKQPIFNRDFDRWYPYNEQAYREFSYALYSRDSKLFLNALKKYQVGYILLDESVIDPDIKNSQQMTFNREAKILIQTIPQIKLDWQDEFLSLYRIDNQFSEVELAYNLPSISPLYHFSFEDQAYSDFGNYLTLEKDGEIFYPFRSFIDKTDKLTSDIKLDLDNFYYKGNIKKLTEDKIVLPALTEDEFNFFKKGGLSIQFSQTSVYGKIPKEKIIIRPKDIEPIGKIKEKNSQKITTEEKIYYESTDKIINSSYDLLSISQQLAYAIGFKSKNINGLPLRICVKSLYSKKCEIYDELSKNKDIGEDIFILPPFNQGVGYKIEILNISYGTIKTINELYEIKIIPLPYHFLKRIRVEKPQLEIKHQSIIPLDFIDFGFAKKVEMENIENENAILIFNQAYEKNWKAYLSETCNVESITCKIKNIFNLFFPFIFGKEIKEHVLVNNWGNGFILSSNTKLLTSNTNKFNIIIIFLPQYLEFLGFLMMGVGILTIILKKE
jgi:hypothetical protein